jgi:hypothetical protein
MHLRPLILAIVIISILVLSFECLLGCRIRYVVLLFLCVLLGRRGRTRGRSLAACLQLRGHECLFVIQRQKTKSPLDHQKEPQWPLPRTPESSVLSGPERQIRPGQK